MRRFSLVTEADARVLEPGSTIELARGGHVTPLAADTLRDRRIVIVRVDGAELDAASLAPVFPVRSVAIGNDHAALALKHVLVVHLRGRGLSVTDVGTHSTDVVDYPDIAAKVGLAVRRREVDAGIVMDGAGLGSTIAANKIRGVRAAMCLNTTLARYAREHNGANVLALGSTLITTDEAKAIVDGWLDTPTREPRYLRRLVKITALEDRRPE